MKLKILIFPAILAGLFLLFRNISSKNNDTFELGSPLFINKTNEIIKEYIGENDIVTKIIFIPDHNPVVTKQVHKILFFILREKGEEALVYKISLRADDYYDCEEVSSNLLSIEPSLQYTTGLTLSQIDFSCISHHISEGISRIKTWEEESHQFFSFCGIGEYIIHLNSNPQKVKYSFTFLGHDTSRKLRSKDMIHKFSFKADSHGGLHGPIDHSIIEKSR